MASSFGPIDLKTKTGRHILFSGGKTPYGWRYIPMMIWDSLTKLHWQPPETEFVGYYNVLDKDTRILIGKLLEKYSMGQVKL